MSLVYLVFHTYFVQDFYSEINIFPKKNCHFSFQLIHGFFPNQVKPNKDITNILLDINVEEIYFLMGFYILQICSKEASIKKLGISLEDF